MATHKSAIKRNRQNLKRNVRNRTKKAEIHTLSKKLLTATGEEALKLLKLVQSKLARAARKNLLHKKAASKRISKIMRAASKKAA